MSQAEEEREGEVRIYFHYGESLFLDGDLVGEYVVKDRLTTYLAFSDGTLIKIREDDNLVLRIERLVVGASEFIKIAPDEKWGELSERAVLKGDLRWVVVGTRHPMQEEDYVPR